MKRLILSFLSFVVFVLIAGCGGARTDIAGSVTQEAAPGETADIDDVIGALQNPQEWVVIDVRTPEEFAGEATLPNAFGSGRIRGTVNVNRFALTCDEDNLIPQEEILEMFDFIGDRKVIVYCHAGLRSGFVQTVLTDLGFHVYNYFGSWVDWSRAASVAEGGPNSIVLSHTEAWTDNEGEIL